MYFVVTWAALLPTEGSYLPAGRVVCVVPPTLHPWEAKDFVCPDPACAAVKSRALLEPHDHDSASQSPSPQLYFNFSSSLGMFGHSWCCSRAPSNRVTLESARSQAGDGWIPAGEQDPVTVSSLRK